VKSARAGGTILAVCGLHAESRIAAGPGVRAIAGADGLATLQQSLETRFAETCGIMSFGIAGSLDNRLATGTTLVACTVIARNQRWNTDQAWSAAVAKCVPGSAHGDIAARDQPIITVAEKRELLRNTGAVAVDTESHIAAQAAAVLGIPLAVFRVIADGADRALPKAAVIALRGDGTIDVRAVLHSVSRSPGQTPLLLRTAHATAIALRALARGRKRLGMRLGFPDLGELLLDVP
jgi:adenosylhomocysteine nucleosidase